MYSEVDPQKAKNETPQAGVSATQPKDVSWLEVSLRVDGEMAEVVAEVLARFAPEGVVIEPISPKDSPEGHRHAISPVRVYAYLLIDASLEQRRQELIQALWYLGKIHHPVPTPEFKRIAQADWSTSWKENYHPVTIGRRLTILPAWMENRDGDRIPIFIEPGMAFGTGTHPSTQMCLEILEDLISEHKNIEELNVIDVGCGSGILSIAALKLGAGYALGVDTDEQAVQIAQENAERNQVLDNIAFNQGSVDTILGGTLGLQRASIVLANLLTPTLLDLLNQGLADLIDQDGWIVLSGILADQMTEIETAVGSVGLLIAEKRQIDDWVALIAIR